MRRAIKIAIECEEVYAQVTYDLGIARIAMTLQSQEKTEFEELFIHLGALHINVSFLKATGTYIDGCGLTTILVESELLGSGSIASFLSSKIYNLCKKVHVLAALSLGMLEFGLFIEKKNIVLNTDIEEYFATVQNKHLQEMNIDNSQVDDVTEKFIEFHEQVLHGDYGHTAQFYAQYITLIKYFLIFDRSIRQSNIELYTHIISQMCNIFFTFNHRNYARWLTYYHDKLLSIDEFYPGLKSKLLIGVKRTDKPFSRVPVDLRLEQTINAESGRRLTGIAHLSNTIDARQRWSLNHALRSTIISHVLIECGLTKKQDVSNDLIPNRIEKSKTDLTNFTIAINNRMNPFSSDVPRDMLVNIATGEAASAAIADFLLNIEKVGQDKKKDFITSCSSDPMNFEKYTIKNTKIMNFASQSKKIKRRIDGKVQEVILQRDLFGRLLAIALNESVDLEKVIHINDTCKAFLVNFYFLPHIFLYCQLLTFPLTPVPFSLCHLDGSIMKTNKAALTKLLESTVDSQGEPSDVGTLLVDGFFLLHTITQLPQTFGQISKQIVQCLIGINRGCQEIHLIFDTYVTPSIKDNEHVLRQNVSREYCIRGKEVYDSVYKTWSR